MNIRLLRHYLMLDPNLDAGTPRASSSLRLTDAILSSYYYSEAMLDRFHHLLLSARSATSVDENILKGLESHTIKQERELSLQITPSGQSLKQISEDTVSTPCALSFGINGLKGSSYFHLSDLVPFTRKPLFIITDCDSSKVSKSKQNQPHCFRLLHILLCLSLLISLVNLVVAFSPFFSLHQSMQSGIFGSDMETLGREASFFVYEQMGFDIGNIGYPL